MIVNIQFGTRLCLFCIKIKTKIQDKEIDSAVIVEKEENNIKIDCVLCLINVIIVVMLLQNLQIIV